MKKIIMVMFLTFFNLNASESYYMITDFSSIPTFLNNDNQGVLKDETSNGEDILIQCNSINPSRYDKCYYPMGDLRNERDGWLNNNNDVDNECIQQPSSISNCPVKVECEPDDENCTETPYERIADVSNCGDWKSGGDEILLLWLECNYDALHLRKDSQFIPFEDLYGKRNGATKINTEAQRMLDSAKELKKVAKTGNENMLPLFGVRHFGYWPHKEFVDLKEIGNNLNTVQTDVSINTLEQQGFMMELMATELSFIMENNVINEKKRIYTH